MHSVKAIRTFPFSQENQQKREEKKAKTKVEDHDDDDDEKKGDTMTGKKKATVDVNPHKNSY